MVRITMSDFEYNQLRDMIDEGAVMRCRPDLTVSQMAGRAIGTLIVAKIYLDSATIEKTDDPQA